MASLFEAIDCGFLGTSEMRLLNGLDVTNLYGQGIRIKRGCEHGWHEGGDGRGALLPVYVDLMVGPYSENAKDFHISEIDPFQPAPLCNVPDSI